MSKIHLVGGEKGGVGKSVVSRVLAQYFIDKQHPLRIYDTDMSHGAMMRHYEAFSTPLDLSDLEAMDPVIEQAAENPEQTLLIDMAAQTTRPLYRWIDDADVLDLAEELGIEITFWHVMDDGKDSLKLLKELLGAYPTRRLNAVVVKNLGRGKDFSPLMTPEIQAKLSEREVPVLALPELHGNAMRKIDRIDASFWAAMNNKNPEIGPCLKLMERQRVKSWLRRFYDQLDELGMVEDT